MRGLLKRFSEYSEKKLRLSQIKMLYQNQLAVDFLNQEFQKAPPGISETADQMRTDLGMFRMWTNNSIVELSYTNVLDEARTRELNQMNKALRNVYGGVIEGRRRARAIFADNAEGLEAFEKRFSPACGWENFSDKEWDKMLNKSLSQIGS